MNARQDCSSFPQRLLFGMVAGELPPNRQLPVVNYPYSAVAFAESRDNLGNSIYSAGRQD
jgi:hypothetical protein